VRVTRATEIQNPGPTRSFDQMLPGRSWVDSRVDAVMNRFADPRQLQPLSRPDDAIRALEERLPTNSIAARLWTGRRSCACL
jgi:hypothetical protein